MEEKDIIKLTDRMRSLCSRREYCSTDIFKKVLTYSEGSHETAANIVDTLIKEKYIDDKRYATAYARDKSAISGWGDIRIRYMLSSKGICKDIISDALMEIDGAKAERRLDRLMQTKVRSLKDDPQIKIKLLRFGLGRGYGYDEVAAAIERLDY